MQRFDNVYDDTLRNSEDSEGTFSKVIPNDYITQQLMERRQNTGILSASQRKRTTEHTLNTLSSERSKDGYNMDSKSFIEALD